MCAFFLVPSPRLLVLRAKEKPHFRQVDGKVRLVMFFRPVCLGKAGPMVRPVRWPLAADAEGALAVRPRPMPYRNNSSWLAGGAVPAWIVTPVLRRRWKLGTAR